MENPPSRFIDQPIQVTFNKPPARQKTPTCPDAFLWEEEVWQILELLSEWKDYARRGRMARNMRPAHAELAKGHGSLGVGRFYFRVRASCQPGLGKAGDQPEARVFDLYYDREIKNVDDRLGHWFLYRELSASSLTISPSKK